MADFRRVLAERVALHRAVRSGLEAASGGPKVVSSCSERCFAVLAGSSRGGLEAAPKSVRSLPEVCPKSVPNGPEKLKFFEEIAVWVAECVYFSYLEASGRMKPL